VKTAADRRAVFRKDPGASSIGSRLYSITTAAARKPLVFRAPVTKRRIFHNLAAEFLALFRQRGSTNDYNEAAVPAILAANEFTIPFDATVFVANQNQIYTGIAFANTDSTQSAHILCTARDTQGKVIVDAVSIPDLSPLGHWAGFDFPALLGIAYDASAVSADARDLVLNTLAFTTKRGSSRPR
jgi:hypothetical protein